MHLKRTGTQDPWFSVPRLGRPEADSGKIAADVVGSVLDLVERRIISAVLSILVRLVTEMPHRGLSLTLTEPT